MKVLVRDKANYQIYDLYGLNIDGFDFTSDVLGNADALYYAENHINKKFSEAQLDQMIADGYVPENWADADIFMTKSDYDWWQWYFDAENIIENKLRELESLGLKPNEKDISDCYQSDYESNIYNLANLLNIDIPPKPV